MEMRQEMLQNLVADLEDEKVESSCSIMELQEDTIICSYEHASNILVSSCRAQPRSCAVKSKKYSFEKIFSFSEELTIKLNIEHELSLKMNITVIDSFRVLTQNPDDTALCLRLVELF